jgi:hypothetical protein
VNYTLEPKAGGNGEFFVYKISSGESKIVFSNNKGLHESKGAEIGSGISAKNVGKIVEKILA